MKLCDVTECPSPLACDTKDYTQALQDYTQALTNEAVRPTLAKKLAVAS